MSFIRTIQQWFGVGGVKATLELKATKLPKAGGLVEGAVIFTAERPQKVNSFSVELQEKYMRGSGDKKQTEFFTLGSHTHIEPFDLAPHEIKKIPFSFSFQPIKSNNDALKEKGGALGTLGSIGSFVQSERSVYTVQSKSSVQGALVGGSAEVKVSLE